MSLISSLNYSSWWSSWWTFLCRTLGFRPGQSGRLLVLGLDNAGKTTLLYTLAQQGSSGSGGSEGGNKSYNNNGTTANATTMGTQRAFPPTDRPALSNTFSVPTGGMSGTSSIQFTAWDLGGHEAVRHLWQEYAADGMIAAIVFVVDAADSERLEEAQYELDALIHDTIAAASNGASDAAGNADGGNGNGTRLPIAILLNKCDLDTALSTEEIVARLDLDALQQQTALHNCQLKVFRISVWQRYGYTEALRWIASQLP
jgi:GTP-binding protein SAR1